MLQTSNSVGLEGVAGIFSGGIGDTSIWYMGLELFFVYFTNYFKQDF